MGKHSKTQLSPGASTKRKNLKRPDRTRPVNKPHKCQHCSYASRNYGHWKTHQRVHTGEKPFKCRHCSFKSAYKYSLTSHERTHTGDRPLKCRYCSFKSAYKSSLKMHERNHTGDEPFKCQHCPYTGIQRAHLILHERTHSGEGPFKCQRCNYVSSRSSGLKIHQKIHMRGNLSKLEHAAKLRRSLATQKGLQSGRKSLKCKIPPETTTVPSEKYAKITDLDSSRKPGSRVPSHLQDLLGREDEFYCQDTQLESSDDLEINESSNQACFEMFICKECNYALLSEKELCMHYSFCHKLPVVSLNTEITDCTMQQ